MQSVLCSGHLQIEFPGGKKRSGRIFLRQKARVGHVTGTLQFIYFLAFRQK